MAVDDICPGAVAGPPPDAYPFSSKAIGEPTLDNCRTCKGTGEVTEYPPDDDERTVACTTCGGTGEVWE
jgi:DnaJ-class molecular chaperone